MPARKRTRAAGSAATTKRKRAATKKKAAPKKKTKKKAGGVEARVSKLEAEVRELKRLIKQAMKAGKSAAMDTKEDGEGESAGAEDDNDDDDDQEEASTLSPEEQASVDAAGRLIPAGKKGVVLVWGSGDMCQLGLGEDFNVRERKFPTVLSTLPEDIEPVQVAAGAIHNLVLGADGSVWSWGSNDDGANGRDKDLKDEGANEWLPGKVEGLEGQHVVQVAAGSSHSVALTSQGRVYSWGSYRDVGGLMGFNADEKIRAAAAPCAGLEGVKVVQIDAGEQHDLALTEDGEVYEWGDIGVGLRSSGRRKMDKLEPRKVVFRRKGRKGGKVRIEAVYAGGYSSYAVDSTGCIWVWGPNNYNQLGVTNADEESEAIEDLTIMVPKPVEELTEGQRVQFAALAVHHGLLLRDGDVYTFGRGHMGRLGHGDEKQKRTPHKVAQLPSHCITSVGAGEAHSFAVTKSGSLWTWGYGDLLTLGNGEEKDLPLPYRVRSKQVSTRAVVQAVGGAQHSIALAYDLSAEEQVEAHKQLVKELASLPAGCEEAAVVPAAPQQQQQQQQAAAAMPSFPSLPASPVQQQQAMPDFPSLPGSPAGSTVEMEFPDCPPSP